MTWAATRFGFSLSVIPGVLMLLTASCGTAGLGLSGSSEGGATRPGSGDGGRTGAKDATTDQGGGGSLVPDGGLLSSEGGPGQCVPRTCTELSATCGPMGDGCGGVIQCGNCTAPATCGGGGKPSNCGGNTSCIPKTCTDLGATCGPASDGCGGLVQCGSCAAPQTCGGGGTPSVCGGNSGCVPKTCTSAGIGCGPMGDGCGGIVQCGNCSTPETCGGGGKPSVCGDGLSDAGDSGGGSHCVPKTCTQLGIGCGPAGDGCGGQLACGSCTAPASCGGGGTPGVCGGTTGCVPKTCTQLGIGCGPAGDGCGGEIASCGTCTAPKTCGGGGTPGVCGGTNACVPKTCAQLGFNCGFAGDGCGGLLQCGTTCPAGESCGGGLTGAPGSPGVCGPTGGTGGACTGLCLKQVACTPSTVTTTITGTVYAPNGVDPIYNALVYIPNAAVSAFTRGVQCAPCSAGVSGSPLVSTNTGPDGTFQLQNVPAGVSLPIVIQVGRWRRQITIPAVTACKDTNTLQVNGTTLKAIGAACTTAAQCNSNSCTAGKCDPLFRLPQSHAEGDIPWTAIVTGNVDALECVLPKIGLLASEFGDPGPLATNPNRIQFFLGNGVAGAKYSGSTPTENSLWGTATPSINSYDMVLFACQGQANTETAQQTVVNFANAGGRIFATHYNYTWLNTSPATGTWVNPFIATANWTFNDKESFNSDPGTGLINTGFTDGQALAQWLQFTGSSSTYGQIPVNTLRWNFNSVVAPSTLWLNVNDTGGYGNVPLQYSFDTPFNPPAGTTECGRVVFEDYHVEDAEGAPYLPPTGGKTFPNECGTGAMTAQEKLLEFQLFDLASCVAPRTTVTPTCTPLTCGGQGFNCGPAGDGCGGQLACGTCTVAGQTCGGGGTPGVCGGTACAPVSCGTQGIQCGPAGDGCGNLQECGNCPNGQTCGGGGQPGKCGKPNCTPITCGSQGIKCGPAGDGCGNLLECGSCPTGEACGGTGHPGICGAPDASSCAPLTCGGQGISCGPAGDGCGGQLACGTCPSGQTCGGGGTPGVCGGTQCTPTTCAAQNLSCGPAGDGCGGQLACGTCPVNETCGGGGTPGVCGSSCVPATCTSLKQGCGPAGDGCGGLLQCGTCTAPNTCGGGGVAGQCGNSNAK